MINLIGSILISLITGILLWYSEVKSNERQRKEITGSFLLKANLAYKIVGILFILIGMILVNVMILNWNEEIKVIAPLVACFFLIPGIMTTMFYYNYRVEFNESRIIVTNWKGKKKIFNWNELIKVSFISSIKCLYLKSNSKKTLINQDSVGFISFIEMMELKTDYTTEKLKIH